MTPWERLKGLPWHEPSYMYAGVIMGLALWKVADLLILVFRLALPHG